MDLERRARLLVEMALNRISAQEAHDKGMFGPVWHGTSEANREVIGKEGFRVVQGDTGSEGMSHGYDATAFGPYWDGIPAPVHHLGYGVYFTTVKAIAKQFNFGTTRGLIDFYLDVPRLEEINFGAERTMMKWWIKHGYNPDLAKVDRVAATQAMTANLASQWDAVWYKGKGVRRLLDGDQICVYDPSRVHAVDKSLAGPMDIGSRVRRKADGMLGVVVPHLTGISASDIKKRCKESGIDCWLHPETTKVMSVKWKRGGTDHNVQDVEVDPA